MFWLYPTIGSLQLDIQYKTANFDPRHSFAECINIAALISTHKRIADGPAQQRMIRADRSSTLRSAKFLISLQLLYTPAAPLIVYKSNLYVFKDDVAKLVKRSRRV